MKTSLVFLWRKTHLHQSYLGSDLKIKLLFVWCLLLGHSGCLDRFNAFFLKMCFSVKFFEETSKHPQWSSFSRFCQLFWFIWSNNNIFVSLSKLIFFFPSTSVTNIFCHLCCFRWYQFGPLETVQTWTAILCHAIYIDKSDADDECQVSNPCPQLFVLPSSQPVDKLK